MKNQHQHRDLALKLLVGRSLLGGLPWTLKEDVDLIRLERTLWDQLSENERLQEQTFLVSLWAKKGSDRVVAVNPDWGPWAAKIDKELSIPDSAFGPSKQQFRPAQKGAFQGVQWLWEHGFQVTEITGDTILLSIDAQRVVPEAERLMRLVLARGNTVRPYGIGLGAWVRSSYDPVSGQAQIELTGIPLSTAE